MFASIADETMEESAEQCCIYIDDSNLFIEGMKYLANTLSLDVKQDHRFRIEPDSFVKALARHRSVMKVIIYGSGRLHKNPIWKVWRESGVQTKVFDRCLKGQEKEVDTTLAADVVDKAACLRFRSKLKPGSVTFVVVSGDRDYLQALRKVLKYKWKLEVVGWSNSVSTRVKDFIEKNANRGARLINLDNLADKDDSIYFTEPRYPIRSKTSRPGFVFEYSSRQSEDDAKALSFLVVDLIKRPCQYYRNDNDPKIIKLVLLVPYTSQRLEQRHERLVMYKFSHFSGLRISFKSTLTLNEEDEDSETEQDDKVEDCEESEDEDEDDNNNDGDDDEDVEQMEKERLEEEEAVKSGKRCVLKYRCTVAKRCLHYHTNSEKEHFSSNGKHLGKLYKSKLCWSVKNPAAGTGDRLFKCLKTAKTCPFAHGLIEARCYNCDPGGLVGEHWIDECPKILYENCAGDDDGDDDDDDDDKYDDDDDNDDD